ncbi:hypothetical protein ACFLXF_01800 [Chloroflexota bacterium]
MKKSSTGSGVAAIRAMENLLPEDMRLFEDPYSKKFLSPFYRFFMVLMRSPGMLNFMIKTRERITPRIIGGLFIIK